MKKLFYFPALLLLAISVISCNDDFLSKNKVNLYTLTDTLHLFNTQDNVDTTLQLSIPESSDYTIIMQPKWLSFSSMHGKMTKGNISLNFSIVKGDSINGYQTHYGTIMLKVETLGLISFIVAYTNFGTPTLLCSVSHLNFESSSSQTFSVKNTSEGILNWEITGIPDWLTIYPTTGSLTNGNSTTITALLNLDNIPTGQELSATMQIKSNSTTGSLTLAVHVSAKAIIPSEVRQISGIVTDAEYNHESGIMAICTKSPNSLILFNTGTNESNTISLSKIPNCVSLSEDGHKAVIGYSVLLISYIDIDNLEIIKDYTIDCVPYDIVLSDNGWCYIAPTADQWVYFRNLNLNSGELILGTYRSEIYEKTIIRKIHGKPFLVGSRTTLSPTGILIFDITRGIAKDTISYYHESLGKFWISEDGTKLYSGYKKVFYLPEYDGQYHTSSPAVFGNIESELSNISSLDECPAINSIFITSSDYSYTSGYSSLIEQFNTANLNKIKTFNVSPVLLTENGTRKLYETSAWFVFVNKEGSSLYILKNLKQSYNKDYWTIETFQINNSGKSANVFNNFNKTK